MDSIVEARIRRWLNDVVIGLNLCPFAAKPTREQRVRFAVSEADCEEKLVVDLQAELEHLHRTPAAVLETTVLIVTDLLQDFPDYNQFLDTVDELLIQQQWQGLYQVASFHPQYRFAGTAAGDAENLTNRSPYPLLHLIREASLTRVLEQYTAADQIPDANIARVKSLSSEEKQRLFPYLSDPNCLL